MSKLYIWIGKFDSAEAFERYMDQQPYYQVLHDGEDDKAELCPFCQEIGESYDEDFLVMIYEDSKDVSPKPSGNYVWLKLLSQVPAKYKAFQKALQEKGVTDGNALIYHDAAELPLAVPENAKSVTFIGSFEEDEPTPLITDEATRFGFLDITWTGKTALPQDEFMTYFTDGRFCQDTGIKSYKPECLSVYFGDTLSGLLAQVENETLRKRLSGYFEHKDPGDVTVLVHYAQDDSLGAAKEPKIKIYPLSLMDRYPVPKGYTAEIESYNGLKFFASFGWV